QNTWMPAGWIYDNLLERVADHVEGANRPLAELLRNACTHRSVGYLDLRSLDAPSFGTIARALDLVRSQVVADGPQAFHDPQFFEGFVQRLDELIQMVTKDPRVVTS